MRRLLKQADEQQLIDDLNPDHVDREKALETEKEINLDGAQMAVEQLVDTVNTIYEEYKTLFTNLNTLYSEYPKLYNEMKMIVKFPSEKDAADITRIKQDLEDLQEHYEDDGYLAKILNLYKDDENGAQ